MNPGPGTCNIPLEYGIQGVPQVAGNGGLPHHQHWRAQGTRRRQLLAHAAVCLEPGGRGCGHQGLAQSRLQDRHPGGRSGRQHLAAAARPWRHELQRPVHRHFQQKLGVERHQRHAADAHQLRIRRGYWREPGRRPERLFRLQHSCHRRPSLVHRRLLPGRLEGEPQVDAESRRALGSVHALRRNPGLPVQLRPCGRQRTHRKLLHPQPGMPDAAGHDLQYRGCSQQYQHRVLWKRRTRQRSKDQLRAARGVRLQAAAYAGGTRRLRHGLWSAGQPRLRRHAGIELSLRLHADHPLARLQSPDARPARASATLENTFNNFNFTNPTVLQSPTPYTGTTVCSTSTLPLNSCVGGQYIGSDYLGATLNGRQFNYPDATGTD